MTRSGKWAKRQVTTGKGQGHSGPWGIAKVHSSLYFNQAHTLTGQPKKTLALEWKGPKVSSLLGLP